MGGATETTERGPWVTLQRIGQSSCSSRSWAPSVEDLARRWGVGNLEGIEERWRDDVLWLLAGMSRVLDVRCSTSTCGRRARPIASGCVE